MRIVMLTDDVQIDRRILLEAESLIDSGHEVVLLAGWAEGFPGCERIGRVRVERLQGGILPRRLQIVQHVHSCLLWGLHWLTPTSQRAGWLLRTWQKLLSVGLRGTNVLARLALHLVQGGGLQPHEWAIFARLQHLKPDIIHAHDLPRLAVAVYAKQRLQLPLIYDAHELYPEIATLSRHQQQVLTRLEQRLVPMCSHIITVNPFLAAEMAKRYRIFPPTVILNATSRPAGFDAAQPWDCFRRCFAIPAEASIVLYQGWMSPTRGLQHLVRAMFDLDESMHLVLMGYGETRSELEQIVAELRLAERVHFKAAVPQAELLFWTASADAGIIPYPPIDLNNYYCSPNKLFEFIQACVPTIANDLPFLRQIVGGEGFGVVAALATVEDYVAAIQQMFDTQVGGPARFQARLQAGVQTYAWDVEAKKLLAIYEEFIPQPSYVA